MHMLISIPMAAAMLSFIAASNTTQDACPVSVELQPQSAQSAAVLVKTGCGDLTGVRLELANLPLLAAISRHPLVADEDRFSLLVSRQADQAVILIQSKTPGHSGFAAGDCRRRRRA